jgi:hypothetical protein
MGYGRDICTADLWPLSAKPNFTRPACRALFFLVCHALQWSVNDVSTEAT